jgi:hypothetical protein
MKKRRTRDSTRRSDGAQMLALRGQFVRVTGEPVRCVVERDRSHERIDHLWITVHAGQFGRLRIAINTTSVQNRERGFDPRIRVGIVRSIYNELPETGIVPAEPLDYGALEKSQFVAFQEYERQDLESLITRKTGEALLIEGWGEIYVRGHLGIHQVHSRRASCVVKTDYIGRDGAIRFYFTEARTEMLLFKFCGQP